MTTKTGAPHLFIGEWHIGDMALWHREDLDLLGPAHLILDRGRQGSMKFLAIEASVNYRLGVRDGLPAVEW
jgi:hypothetical protein